jgi:hypothetical protein
MALGFLHNMFMQRRGYFSAELCRVLVADFAETVPLSFDLTLQL